MLSDCANLFNTNLGVVVDNEETSDVKNGTLKAANLVKNRSHQLKTINNQAETSAVTKNSTEELGSPPQQEYTSGDNTTHKPSTDNTKTKNVNINNKAVGTLLSKTAIENPELTWAQAVNNGSWRAQTRYMTDKIRITHDDFEELELGPEARFKLKLAFLKREARRGDKEKGTACNRTQIDQILAKVKDEEELVYALNDLPENDLTLRLELVNPDHIPESQMYRIIRTKFLDLIEELREVYFQACQERVEFYDDILEEKDNEVFVEKVIAIGEE